MDRPSIFKNAKLVTELQPHQQRAIDKMMASGGVLVVHGLGSGKTLTSIAAGEQSGLPTEAVVPAPLVANYHKELAKHLDKPPADARVRSYEKAVQDNNVDPHRFVVLDEVHRARNANTLIAKRVADPAMHAEKRMLLTGTPVYNDASDLAPLLNTAAGRRILPEDRNLFKQTFVGEKVEQAPFLTRLKGQLLGHPVDNASHPALINRDRLVQAARGYVDVHRGGGIGFPDKIEEKHEVELSPKQWEMYKFHEGSMPWYLKAKVRAGLPLDKKESKELNAFQGALRQVSNTARPYLPDMTDDEEDAHTPKIQKMVEHLVEMRAKNPEHRGVVYSNYLDSGVLPMSRALTKAGVPHHVFTGDVSKARRAQMVLDYNSGKVPVLLVSGAGSEGLDLKGTRSVQIMEPHWNNSRIEQVIGRGVRYLSHEHLPKDQRNVRVMKYYSTLPKEWDEHINFLIGAKKKKSIEQYLQHTADEKSRLSNDIMNALEEASNYGPLKKRATREDSELVRRIVDRIGDMEESTQGRKKTLVFKHPIGVDLESPYDPNFIAENVRNQFGGDHNAFADQVRDDLLNMGYAASGSLAKKNQQRQKMRAIQGAAWGSLTGTMLGTAVPEVIMRPAVAAARYAADPSHHLLLRSAAGVGTLAAGLGVPVALPVVGGTIGYQIGKHTYRDVPLDGMVAKNTHPLLMPPKPVKAKVKLEVKEK